MTSGYGAYGDGSPPHLPRGTDGGGSNGSHASARFALLAFAVLLLLRTSVWWGFDAARGDLMARLGEHGSTAVDQLTSLHRIRFVVSFLFELLHLGLAALLTWALPSGRRALGMVAVAGSAALLAMMAFDRVLPIPALGRAAPDVLLFALRSAYWLVMAAVAIARDGALVLAGAQGRRLRVAPFAVALAVYAALLFGFDAVSQLAIVARFNALREVSDAVHGGVMTVGRLALATIAAIAALRSAPEPRGGGT
jgi:hypothetical protein